MASSEEQEHQLRNDIFNVTENDFSATALRVFQFQYEGNELYRQYCDLLRICPEEVNSIEKIPFLPIQFFKTAKIKTRDFEETLHFESSGTTGSVNSRHYVKDPGIYEESFLKAFRKFYGDETKLCIIGLLPSYLERGNSSLVYMVDRLIRLSANENSGFYLYDFENLKTVLLKNEKASVPTLLIGVTYALLDFAEQYPMQLDHTIVMETGGMKGRREELSRTAVHEILKKQFSLKEIHSEYGMTELLSQAYSAGEGIFHCPQWMRVLVRKEDDPFLITANVPAGKKMENGAANIIDLANLYSCSFIATDDAAKIYPDKSFEIIGRLDNSDIRGCSLMLL